VNVFVHVYLLKTATPQYTQQIRCMPHNTRIYPASTFPTTADQSLVDFLYRPLLLMAGCSNIYTWQSINRWSQTFRMGLVEYNISSNHTIVCFQMCSRNKQHLSVAQFLKVIHQHARVDRNLGVPK